MKNWQKTRNYRRMKDENGNVIANVITVFGEKIEVSDELFTVYAHMDAHERYIMEEAPRGRVFFPSIRWQRMVCRWKRCSISLRPVPKKS